MHVSLVVVANISPARHPFLLSQIVCSNRLERYRCTCTDVHFVSLSLVFQLSSLPTVPSIYAPILYISFINVFLLFLL